LTKIVFVIDALRIGGIQNSLVNLLKKINYEKFEVSLIAFSVEESFKRLIPAEVKLIKMPKILALINTPSNDVRKKGLSLYFIRKILAIGCKIFSGKVVYSLLFSLVNLKDMCFDLAISYTNNGNVKSVYFGSNKFVIDKIKAKRKISWLHVDYKAMNMSNKTNNKEYEKFDKIVCVSKDTEAKFLECCPQFENKTCVIYNIVDVNHIKNLSNAEFVMKKDNFTILTVCRLDRNKNVEQCLRIASLLKEKHFDFQWLIVGDGPDRKKLEAMAYSLNVADNINFLGYKENPYSYIKNSDVFVSTSISESFGLSIYESLILGVPVVVRRYDAIDEVIRNKADGYIVSENDYDFVEAIIETTKAEVTKTELPYDEFVETRNVQALMKLEELANVEN